MYIYIYASKIYGHGPSFVVACWGFILTYYTHVRQGYLNDCSRATTPKNKSRRIGSVTTIKQTHQDHRYNLCDIVNINSEQRSYEGNPPETDGFLS